MAAAEETVVHPIAGDSAEHAAQEVVEEPAATATAVAAARRAIAWRTAAHHGPTGAREGLNNSNQDPEAGDDRHDRTNPAPHVALLGWWIEIGRLICGLSDLRLIPDPLMREHFIAHVLQTRK